LRPFKAWAVRFLRRLQARGRFALARFEGPNGSRAAPKAAPGNALVSVETDGKETGGLPPQDGQPMELVYRIAHELKAPLTAIIYSSELLGILERLDASPDAHKEALIRNIGSNASRVNRRISELLDFLRVRQGDLELQTRPLAIGPVVTEVASHLGGLFDSKGQSLELDLPDSLPPVQADRDRLQRILSNLLENANELSPDNSSITVTARQVGQTIVVEVKDSAPAITEDDTRRLFDLCYTGEGANGRQPLPELGPSLAILKQLVELHHGEIWVESEIGKGNTFAFSLPVLP